MLRFFDNFNTSYNKEDIVIAKFWPPIIIGFCGLCRILYLLPLLLKKSPKTCALGLSMQNRFPFDTSKELQNVRIGSPAIKYPHGHE